MTLDEWAERWGVPDEAVRELAAIGSDDPDDETRYADFEGSEAGVQSRVRIEAASAGWHVFRNNVGAAYMIRPKDLCPQCAARAERSFVRYGLANDSKKLNGQIKSADLIGWRPRLITVDDAGKIIAQFVSRECKRSDWRYTGTPEEEAQVRWHALVLANGGDSAIINSTGSIHA